MPTDGELLTPDVKNDKSFTETLSFDGLEENIHVQKKWYIWRKSEQKLVNHHLLSNLYPWKVFHLQQCETFECILR